MTSAMPAVDTPDCLFMCSHLLPGSLRSPYPIFEQRFDLFVRKIAPFLIGIGDRETAAAAAHVRAKSLIDELGDRLERRLVRGRHRDDDLARALSAQRGDRGAHGRA